MQMVISKGGKNKRNDQMLYPCVFVWFMDYDFQMLQKYCGLMLYTNALKLSLKYDMVINRFCVLWSFTVT